MKVKADKAINNKLIFRILLIIFGILLILYCSYFIASNAADITRLKAEKAELDSKYEQQIEENEEAKAILESDDKDAYIEQKAREKGYVKDGETVFSDIN